MQVAVQRLVVFAGTAVHTMKTPQKKAHARTHIQDPRCSCTSLELMLLVFGGCLQAAPAGSGLPQLQTSRWSCWSPASTRVPGRAGGRRRRTGIATSPATVARLTQRRRSPLRPAARASAVPPPRPRRWGRQLAAAMRRPAAGDRERRTWLLPSSSRRRLGLARLTAAARGPMR
jgi:hypothetical protein